MNKIQWGSLPVLSNKLCTTSKSLYKVIFRLNFRIMLKQYNSKYW